MSWSRQKEEHDVTNYRHMGNTPIQHVKIHRRQIYPGFGAIGIEVATTDKNLKEYFSQHKWVNENDLYFLSQTYCSHIDNIKKILDLLANADNSITVSLKFQLLLETNQALTSHGSSVYKKIEILENIFLPELLSQPNKKLVLTALERAEKTGKMKRSQESPATNSSDSPIIFYYQKAGEMKRGVIHGPIESLIDSSPDTTIFYLAEYLFESYLKGEDFVTENDIFRAYSAIPKDSHYVETANQRLLQFLETYSKQPIEKEENESDADFSERRRSKLENIFELASQLNAQQMIDNVFDQLCGNDGDRPELTGVKGDAKDLMKLARTITKLNNKINGISLQLIAIMQHMPKQELNQAQTPFLFSTKHLQPMLYTLTKSASASAAEYNPSFHDEMTLAAEKAINGFNVKNIDLSKYANANVEKETLSAIVSLIEHKTQQADSLKLELKQVNSRRAKL